MDVEIIYLEAKETAIVVDFCKRLLQLYSSHNIGKVKFVTSNVLSYTLQPCYSGEEARLCMQFLFPCFLVSFRQKFEISWAHAQKRILGSHGI